MIVVRTKPMVRFNFDTKLRIKFKFLANMAAKNIKFKKNGGSAPFFTLDLSGDILALASLVYHASD